MRDNAENAAYEAARQKYYRDRAKLLELFGAQSLNYEWLIERKYGAYVATKCRSGFQIYGKSMREIIDALRAAGIRIDSNVKFVVRGS